MTTLDFITELFCRIDDALSDVAKHPPTKRCSTRAKL